MADARSKRLERLRIQVRGGVQGVGFRPFVYLLATGLGLSGWVRNDADGVEIAVEGPRWTLRRFLARLEQEAPPGARVDGVQVEEEAARGESGFAILTSVPAKTPTAVVLSDGATCAACLREVLDPKDRRYRYPFTNCTHCGPRFSIVTGLPYDRRRTTMASFTMCPACRREYDDPGDRRFHAQPNACPACGPRLALRAPDGTVLAEEDDALLRAAEALRHGRILALKGVGGFQLLVDATRDDLVARLRVAKARIEKPLAVMARDLDAVRALGEVSRAAERLLTSPSAPIVLLPRRPDSPLSRRVAPGNPRVGVMLPTSPLHHLLLREVPFPVVATSGNRSDEPICTEDGEALERLAGIADVFLVHDRPIARHVDDSVVALEGREVHPVRRARGYAPQPVPRPGGGPVVLALGGHLKNVVALAVGDRVFLSQHVGDLDTPQALEAFERVIADFLGMYGVVPEVVAHDLHASYASTRWLEDVLRGPDREAWRRRGLAGAPRVAVQHHHAHLASCLAEHGAKGPALGVTWDGTGYGTDGTVWGGEFLLGDLASFRRVASLAPFRLPGGDGAAREPRRSAVALLHGSRGAAAFDALPASAFTKEERRVLDRMLERGFRSPVTTSAGRLFDGVAALVDQRYRSSFEGQAAMELEFAADAGEEGAYPMPLRAADDRLLLDWRPTIDTLLEERDAGVPVSTISARFHGALAEGILRVAKEVGQKRVVLSGGCFQNRVLRERTRRALKAAGFRVLVHREVPCNDGGIALGQVAVAGARAAARAPR